MLNTMRHSHKKLIRRCVQATTWDVTWVNVKKCKQKPLPLELRACLSWEWSIGVGWLLNIFLLVFFFLKVYSHIVCKPDNSFGHFSGFVFTVIMALMFHDHLTLSTTNRLQENSVALTYSLSVLSSEKVPTLWEVKHWLGIFKHAHRLAMFVHSMLIMLLQMFIHANLGMHTCYHPLYDLARDISPSYKLNSLNFDSEKLSVETLWDYLNNTTKNQ